MAESSQNSSQNISFEESDKLLIDCIPTPEIMSQRKLNNIIEHINQVCTAILNEDHYKKVRAKIYENFQEKNLSVLIGIVTSSLTECPENMRCNPNRLCIPSNLKISDFIYVKWYVKDHKYVYNILTGKYQQCRFEFVILNSDIMHIYFKHGCLDTYCYSCYRHINYCKCNNKPDPKSIVEKIGDFLKFI